MNRLSVALLLMLAVLSGCQGDRSEPSAPAPAVSEKSGEGPDSVAEEQPESHSPPIDESPELEIPKFEPIVVPVFRPSDTRPEYALDDYEPRDIRRLSSRRRCSRG